MVAVLRFLMILTTMMILTTGDYANIYMYARQASKKTTLNMMYILVYAYHGMSS